MLEMEEAAARAAFEVWADEDAGEAGPLDFTRDGKTGAYEDWLIETHWKAWCGGIAWRDV